MKYDERFCPVEGTVDRGEISVYALSTCGFCKRALAFLRNHSIKFRFIYVDDLPIEEKEDIKAELFNRFNQQVRFPFMVINGERCVVGFTEDEWKEFLGVDK